MKNNSKNLFVLLILDGWGYQTDPDHNAIAHAKTPHMGSLVARVSTCFALWFWRRCWFAKGQMETQESVICVWGQGV